MSDTNKNRSFKGGAGMAIAVILAWALGEAGIVMPDMVQAAGAALIGSLIAWIRE